MNIILDTIRNHESTMYSILDEDTVVFSLLITVPIDLKFYTVMGYIFLRSLTKIRTSNLAYYKLTNRASF